MKRTRIVIRRWRDMDGVIGEIGAASEVAADISGGNGHVADSWILARSLTEHCLDCRRNLSQKVSHRFKKNQYSVFILSSKLIILKIIEN